ncbi:MAG: vitamin K epoxide reductase family protein [Planctomycetaceae bacterium]
MASTEREASAAETNRRIRKRESLEVIPHPWNYNPSSWRQRIPIAGLAMVAFAIAAYMGLYQWRLIPSAWDPVFGNQTQQVLDSTVSERMRIWFLIPDASFGAIAYLGDAIFGLAGSTRRWQYRPWMVVLFGIDVIPLGIVSAVLVVLQGTVVGSWCFLCLVTAAISLILVYWAYDEVWSCLLYLHRVKQRTQGWSIVWKTFWGIRTPEAEEIAVDFVRLPEEFYGRAIPR